jgi:hypothetical protein
LEFDIGFLLDVNFLIRRAAFAGLRTVMACARSIRVLVIANADPRLLGHFSYRRIWAGYGIWYARSKVVKARSRVEVLKIRVT